jgi:LuxR family maltose regulon positive regulatory protein
MQESSTAIISLPTLPEHLRRQASGNPSDGLQLHVQASEWYEAQGQPEPAIRHALAGQAWSRAAYLIDQQADQLISQETVDELPVWLEALPEGVLPTWPRLQIIQAHLLLLEGDPERVGLLLKEVTGRLIEADASINLHLPASDPAQDGYQETLGHLDEIRARLALRTGQNELALELARRAIQRLPLTRPVWRSWAAGCAAKALAQSGANAQACRYYSQARAEAELANSPLLGLRFGLDQLDCLWNLGELRDALQLCQDLLGSLLEQTDRGEGLAARVYARWAHFLAERGRGDEALAAALQAQVLAGDDLADRVEIDLGLARAYLARRDIQAARHVLSPYQEKPMRQSLAADILRIDIELCAGQLETARQGFMKLGLDPDSSLVAEPDDVRRLAARWLLARGKPGLARKRLEALHKQEDEQGRQTAGVETLILLALVYQALDKEQACLDALSQALFLAAPQGWVGPFLRYGREMAWLLYRAGVQDIQPEFIIRLLDRIPLE